MFLAIPRCAVLQYPDCDQERMFQLAAYRRVLVFNDLLPIDSVIASLDVQE